MLTARPAAAGDVISAGPASAAVTIYRDDAIPDPAAAQWGGQGLAMIAETRVVDLPAGESRLVLEGVSDGAIPETAALEGLPGHIVEQNFDYDLLSPGSLIEHSVGQPVQLVRINPRTGKRTTEDATLVSGPNGVVLDVGGRTQALGCSGEPEGLVFTGVPTELTGKAALSTHIRVDRPGRYTLRLAYLTVGMAWSANYVAEIAPDATRLDLTGWITLANHGDTSFPDAPTSVVAGRLARQDVQRIEAALAQRRSACWPMGNSHHPPGHPIYHGTLQAPGGAAVAELMVTAERREESIQKVPTAVTAFTARQSDLGDYKLYTLAGPTTVAARQTKQVKFLEQDAVKFDRVYVYKLQLDRYSPVAYAESTDAGQQGPATTTLRMQNKASDGLGRSLPEGSVSVRQPQGGRDRFLGQPDMRDVPVGEPFELEIGEAPDVQVRWRVTALTRLKLGGRDAAHATVEADITNAKAVPVAVEVRHLVELQGFKVIAESRPHATKAGDPVWRVPLPANGTASVTYTVEYLTE